MDTERTVHGITHGTHYGYLKKGCRCVLCRKVRADYKAMWRDLRRNPGEPEPYPMPDSRRDTTWMADGKCRVSPPERRPDFYTFDWKNIYRAKAFCQNCPVKALCLEYALDGYEYGIWGGTTWRERAQLRRQRRTA